MKKDGRRVQQTVELYERQFVSISVAVRAPRPVPPWLGPALRGGGGSFYIKIKVNIFENLAVLLQEPGLGRSG